MGKGVSPVLLSSLLPRAALRRHAWLGILLGLLFGGCGFAPTESKLAGTWQVDLPPPQKIVYTFQTNHTYTMTLTGREGALQGTWKLEGSLLSLTMKSFAAYGMTNPLPVVTGLKSQKNAIVRLTDSRMVWRTGVLGGGLKFKRLASEPPSYPSLPRKALSAGPPSR